MIIKQISIFLENKPGELSRPAKLLAKAHLNILTLCLADTQDFGILRIIVREWEKAKALLEKNGFTVRVNDMVALEVQDRPGGLAAILEVVEKAGVNLEYMYGFTLSKAGKGILAFRFDNPEAAVRALSRKGLQPVGGLDLFERSTKVAVKGAAKKTA